MIDVKSVYLDACTIIYMVEGAEPGRGRILKALTEFDEEESSRFVTSRLSLLECRVRAIRTNNVPLIEKYRAFFDTERLFLAEIDGVVIERATQLRVQYAFKTPDAIHLATAIELGSEVFLTGDNSLQRCKEVSVRLLG